MGDDLGLSANCPTPVPNLGTVMQESKDTSAQLNPAGIERRTAERNKPLQPTTCRLVLAGREETRWARIENVCAMGLGLLLLGLPVYFVWSRRATGEPRANAHH